MIKKISSMSFVIIILICLLSVNFQGCKNSDNQTININHVENSNNTEAKQKILTTLLDELKKIDSGYSESKAESLSKADKAKYMDDLASQYISLIEKTYSSISDLENEKEKINIEKQTALSNVKKASDDVKISYEKAGGGSGASTDIPYAKMNAARKEVCHAFKTYFECSEDILERKEMKDDNDKKSSISLDKVQNDYIDINRKLLKNDTLAIPDAKITESTPDNDNKKAYIITSSMVIPNSGLGSPKYYPIKMKLQYDKNGEYTFKSLDPNEIN